MSDRLNLESDVEENRHNWSDEPKHYPPIAEECTSSSQLTVIDLFCGPGGISKGLEWADFKPILGVDIHEPSIETFRKNHRSAHAILGDIRHINKRRSDDRNILEVLESNEVVQETPLTRVAKQALNGKKVDLLTAGIPCQGFSLANRKQHDEDQRNYLFEEFIRGVRLLDPRYILIENVSTMKS
ncbi:MAG: DNA cytosine methyltransferase, partial [Halobacteriaceae archaeon]